MKSNPLDKYNNIVNDKYYYFCFIGKSFYVYKNHTNLENLDMRTKKIKNIKNIIIVKFVAKT